MTSLFSHAFFEVWFELDAEAVQLYYGNVEQLVAWQLAGNKSKYLFLWIFKGLS